MNARALALGTLALLILGARPPAASSGAETSWLHFHIEQPEQRSRVRSCERAGKYARWRARAPTAAICGPSRSRSLKGISPIPRH